MVMANPSAENAGGRVLWGDAKPEFGGPQHAVDTCRSRGIRGRPSILASARMAGPPIWGNARSESEPAASTPEEETTVSTWKTVLVGVDGSRGSRKALVWAAAEALDHGAELVVLNVWEHALLPPVGSGSVPLGDVSGPRGSAAEDLVQIIKEELGEDPPVVAQPVVKHGRPAEILIEQSAGGDQRVGGTRGHGGFAGLVLGSVSQHVAAYAQCPVTVVR
jgi:nucleotide-binding universal stress UspA family protein